MKFCFSATNSDFFPGTPSIDSEKLVNQTKIYVKMETDNETLDILLNEMTKFLKMSGYQFEGTLKLVDEK